MSKITIVMLEEAREVFEEVSEYPEFDRADFLRTVVIKGEDNLIFGWDDLSEDEEDNLKEVLAELAGMDVQYLFLKEDEKETTISGNEFNGIWSWYKNSMDMFGAKNEKIVLFVDEDDSEVLMGVVVDKNADPSASINKVMRGDEFSDWNVEDIVNEWSKGEYVLPMDVQSYYV